METVKNNKLIAEFMGCTNPFNEITDATLYNVSHGTFELNELRYDVSWDWLMPVVNMIESMRSKKGNAFVFTIDMCNVNIDETNINILGCANKFDAVYTSVLEFINKYNNEQLNK